MRQRYAYRWGIVHEALFGAAVLAGHYLLPWLPEVIRVLPPARRAAVRTSAKTRPGADICS